MKFLMTLAVVLAMSNSVLAESKKVTPMDGLPVPFAQTNQRVELAADEIYGLYGYLQYNSKYGIMEFHPDFEAQPWLATNNRKSIGYYPMTRFAKNWVSNLDGKYVRMMFKAQGRMYQNDYSASYVLWLDPISTPVESARPIVKSGKKN